MNLAAATALSSSSWLAESPPPHPATAETARTPARKEGSTWPRRLMRQVSPPRDVERLPGYKPEKCSTSSGTLDPPPFTAGLREPPALRAVVAHLRAAAGQAGTWARAGLGALAGRALLLDGGSLRRLGLLLIGEDLVLGLALEQGDELVGLDRLAVQQDPRDRVELLAVLGEDVLRSLVCVLDHPA